MQTKLERDVRVLKLYAALTTAAFAVFVFSGFSERSNKQSFEEIDVERINIIEADGTLRMVISNRARQHPGIVNGDTIVRSSPRPPGMIFFNHLGDEMGGLVFGENGEIGHFGSLTFDKVRNDQTIGFRYLEGDSGTYETGLQLWQQPNIPGDVMMAQYQAADTISDVALREAALQAIRDKNEITTRRLFLGKWRDNTTLLQMRDIKGTPRIKLMVSPDGTPTLEFMDESGNVTYSVPE
jgi:hypothetical protein